MKILDEKLTKRSYNSKKEKQKEDKIKNLNINTQQIVYTARQLADALPGISYPRIRQLIAEGKIRTIPAGAFDSRWEVIPHVTLMEDLMNLVEKYN